LVTLNAIKQGQVATIVSILGKGSFRQRLLEMGIVPGTPVKVIQNSRILGLVHLEVRRSRLSLRLEEAKNISVDLGLLGIPGKNTSKYFKKYLEDPLQMLGENDEDLDGEPSNPDLTETTDLDIEYGQAASRSFLERDTLVTEDLFIKNSPGASMKINESQLRKLIQEELEFVGKASSPGEGRLSRITENLRQKLESIKRKTVTNENGNLDFKRGEEAGMQYALDLLQTPDIEE